MSLVSQTYNLRYPLSLLFITLAFISCNKVIDDSPVIGEPGIVANISIKDVKARYTSGAPVEITDDIVIEGIVSCDDRSGNYYQQIAIQDETGGVLLRLSGNNLFNNYPVGRKLFVKLKGLFLGQYNGTLQFGGGVDSRYISTGGVTPIAYNLFDKCIIKGQLNQQLVPKVITASELTTSLQDKHISTLIKLLDYEFAATDTAYNYSESSSGYRGRTIQACISPNANKFTLYSSSYATFANIKLPKGNGSIIGVYSVFGSIRQISIRDTSDVNFVNTRCSSGTGSGTVGPLPLVNSPYVQNFDGIAGGLPQGITVKIGANASSLGTGDMLAYGTSGLSSTTAWNQTSAGLKNFASATGLTSTSDVNTQTAHVNRALGIRQTSATGYDPGASYVLEIENTTGKSNFRLNFLLQSLDAPATAGRTTTWKVEYGFGVTPVSFTTATTIPSTLTTALGTFSSVPVTVNFGNALDNNNQKVWIRIVTLAGTTGGGSRASTAIDDLQLTWN